MECTICYRVDSKLTPIDAKLVAQHRLCDRCLSDLFTKDFEQGLSSDSDDSTSNFEIKSNFNLADELHLEHESYHEYDDDVSIKSESGVLLIDKDANTLEEDVKPATISKKAIPKDKLKEKCALCDERTTNRRSLAAHMRRSHPEEKVNRCHICRLFFKGVEQFEEHIRSEHAGFSHICVVCLEGYGRGEKLEHEKSCIGRLLFECIECREQFVSKEGLMKHLDSHQILEDLKESSYQEMRALQRIHTCVLCDDHQGYEENAYWNHVHRDHDGRHLRCPDCGKTFRNRKHMVVHTGVQCKVGAKAREKAAKMQKLVQSRCQYCSKSFRNRTLLQNHVAKIHKAKPVVCDICGLSLANRNQMRYHRIKSHTEPAEKCPHCPKQFHLATDLRQHLTTHDVIGKFICEECGRVFKRKVGLELHIKSHLKDAGQPNRRMIPGTSGKYACELCDRRFKHNYVLLTHMKIHDPDRVLEKKYDCKECDRKFATSAGLYYHMKGKYVHQKMTCPVCSAVVKGKERYEDHLAVHSEQR
ncbi:zinc finger protein 585B-like [Ochlerotatus camptorhynchus]|uniref:zinc finger protein 585B-like n=1 Tax=Ochlerotatus camptorhynchus TaxID=644619 RepID=UPI0031D01150